MANFKSRSNWYSLVIVFLVFGNYAWCNETQSKQVDTSVEGQRKLAVDALKDGQTAKAISIFKQIVDKNPEDAQANMDYGGMLFGNAGQFYHRGQKPAFSSEAMPVLKEAKTYLEKAAKLFGTDDPKDKALKTQAYYLLGDIDHYGFDSLDKAEEEYKTALSLTPQYESPKKELAYIEKERAAQTK